MIHDVIRRRVMLFYVAYHKDPEYVYLGHKEWCELVAYPHGTVMHPSENHERFMGIELIRVAKESHLNVA